MRCDLCKGQKCREGEPCVERKSIELYSDPHEKMMMQTAAFVESEFYGDLNRIEEVVEFASRMGYKKLGIAFCVGLREEAVKIADFLSNFFEIEAICCKVCGIPKSEMGAPMSDRVGPVSCNPIEQARMFEEKKTDLNLVIGLCVGHDALFIKHSHTYVVPLVVKDRVLGHNPLAAVYCSAVNKRMKKRADERKQK
ncbi:MAG: DUF1847 domain-containing protein [Synergistaceae bacterium]|nr:DUF1847 domain-containing protein [Synergistaceae bacterium]